MPVRVALPLSPSAYTYTSYPFVLDGKPATVTVVVVFPVSKYPFIIRAFPGASVIHVDQVLFEVHDTVAVVAAPVSSTNASGAVLAAPLALFQFGSATTPATSADPIGTSPPTKSMLSTFPVVPPDEATVKLTVAVCVSVPLVPVIVSVYVPAAVLLPVATVSVELPPALTDAGLNVPVAPAGSPLTLSPTVPVNPFTAPVFTVYVVLLPAFTVCALGAAEIVKSGVFTVKLTVAVCVSVPLVPVIVSVYVPAAVLLPVATVSVALPPALTDVGLNVPVAPAGSPLTLSPTVPVNPFTAPVFTVYVVLLPAFTVCALGVPDKLKSGLGELNGTIWMPLTGARGYASVELPGVAVMVKPDTFGIVNTT